MRHTMNRYVVALFGLLTLINTVGVTYLLNRSVSQSASGGAHPSSSVPTKEALSPEDAAIVRKMAGVYVNTEKSEEKSILALNVDQKYSWKNPHGRICESGSYKVHPTRKDELLLYNDDEPQGKPESYYIRESDLWRNYNRFVKR